MLYQKEYSDLSSPSADAEAMAQASGGQGAVILAGGLGTRLRSAVPDLPKCMAPVAGRPFLFYVINHLLLQGVQQFVFSLGYKSEVVIDYLKEAYPALNYDVVIEEEPLGTGGAVLLALSKTIGNDVVIANGDTLFKIDLAAVTHLHKARNAACTLALKPAQQFDRYGVVDVDDIGKIVSFKEKQFYKNGLINGGVYLLNREEFLKKSFPQKFSFEKDYLEKAQNEGGFYGCVQDYYFIDIGIPEDYEKAGIDLKQPILDLKNINKNWTLFIDRDGVINEELPKTYVLNREQFRFSKGVFPAIKKLAELFGKIIVVTNQRGVGKGLMTHKDLQQIHTSMVFQIEENGGRIDAIFYCTDVDMKSFNRKPNPGMAISAKKGFPDIDFSKAIMVGNTLSDMQFGRAAGMHTVFIASTNPDQPFPHPDIDAIYPSLAQFAADL